MNPVVMLLIGGIAGYGVGRMVHKRADKPIKVLALGPACSTWEVLDADRAGLVTRKAYVEARLEGMTDALKLVRRVLQAIASKCRPVPRNIGELNLYASVFDSVLALLYDDALLTDDQREVLQIDFDAWHALQIERLS